jgi:hypothetical protein
MPHNKNLVTYTLSSGSFKAVKSKRLRSAGHETSMRETEVKPLALRSRDRPRSRFLVGFVIPGDGGLL